MHLPKGIICPLASAQRLAQHPNIIGLKDSWGDMVLFLKQAGLLGMEQTRGVK
jgi:dihydrodipicolinate synthase/N-acetylneuraminate lyase